MIVKLHNEIFTLAISKGRIYREATQLLEHLGIKIEDNGGNCRKLILKTNEPNLQLLIIRASDVSTYVSHGAADMGITGKDTLLEYPYHNIYEPLDLQIANCRMMLADLDQPLPKNRRIRIATKYINSTRKYFANKGKQVEIIKLYGSMELAPLLNLSDQIVDLVDTGKTLAANGLIGKETLMDISARLIVNKASMKMKRREIEVFIERFAKVIER